MVNGCHEFWHFPRNIGYWVDVCHHPHWRSPSFFRGVAQPPTSCWCLIINHSPSPYSAPVKVNWRWSFRNVVSQHLRELLGVFLLEMLFLFVQISGHPRTVLYSLPVSSGRIQPGLFELWAAQISCSAARRETEAGWEPSETWGITRES